LLTSLTGVTTDEAFGEKVSAIIDGVPVFVLGRGALIRNNRAAGRPQDLADLAALTVIFRCIARRHNRPSFLSGSAVRHQQRILSMLSRRTIASTRTVRKPRQLTFAVARLSSEP